MLQALGSLAEGAYLAAGDVWLALVVDKNARRGPLAEYSHIAFQVSAETYEKFVARVLDVGARVFQENKTEGASLYFLDPDGHKLEVHVGDLQSRLESARRHPWNGLELFD